VNTCPTSCATSTTRKDLFKALQEVVERRNDDGQGFSYTKDLTWVTAHVYTVDVFLWCLARRGYTLQRSRKRLQFSEIGEFIAEAQTALPRRLGSSSGLGDARQSQGRLVTSNN
jgi:hypothetical protein